MCLSPDKHVLIPKIGKEESLRKTKFGELFIFYPFALFYYDNFYRIIQTNY